MGAMNRKFLNPNTLIHKIPISIFTDLSAKLGNFTEGDIIAYSPAFLKRNAIIGEEYRWPNHEIPFVFARGTSENNTVTSSDTLYKGQLVKTIIRLQMLPASYQYGIWIAV